MEQVRRTESIWYPELHPELKMRGKCYRPSVLQVNAKCKRECMGCVGLECGLRTALTRFTEVYCDEFDQKRHVLTKNGAAVMGDQQTQQSQSVYCPAVQLTLSELSTSDQLKRPLALTDHINYNGSLAKHREMIIMRISGLTTMMNQTLKCCNIERIVLTSGDQPVELNVSFNLLFLHPVLQLTSVQLGRAFQSSMAMTKLVKQSSASTASLLQASNQNFDPNATEVNGKVDIDFSELQLSCCKKQNCPHGSSKQLTMMAENNSYGNFVKMSTIRGRRAVLNWKCNRKLESQEAKDGLDK
ncbi:hypothetical protein DUI87_17951 [Hirundo rustica rustica]|uniref:Uncharacterized protein n=1 Tax=Hirundo rustica rustica TaxID=333673 RepID=A0A3M0JVB7_HIRRU|nr:hypothetical protein DUI87_17951 [Hirundo rustica rustica]